MRSPVDPLTVDLRNFHIVFICASILLCLMFGAWALNRGEAGYVVAGIVSVGAGFGLVLYGQWFLRKMKSGSDPR